MKRFFSYKFFVFSALPWVLGLLFFQTLQAQSSAVESVVAKLNSMNSFVANVSIGMEGQTIRGELSYQRGRINLQLSDGRVIASNGHQLIIYNPGSGIAGKQDLQPGAAGGPGWLLHGFTTEVTGNTAHLTAANPGSYYREVRLKWSGDFMLREIAFLSKNSDSWMTIGLSNVRLVKSFPASLFSYKPPAGSRTVENPLNQSN